MGKPCAVFWDIQDFDVPKGQTVNSIVDLIRSTIIKPYNLNEIFFFCVCEHECPSNVGQSLTNLDVDIIQAFNRGKDSVDIKILALMKKFVKVAGQDCTIIFLSDYADCISTLSDDDNYYRTLSDLKKLHNVSIHLIRLAKLCSPKLDQISDYTFMLNDGVLKPIKSSGSPMYFISIKNYPLIFTVNQLMDQFNARTVGSIGYSAILYSGTICIGFPTLCLAENAIKLLNGCQFHGKFLIVELIVDSPLTEILKCIKPNVTMQSERKHELKQLTFIKMSSSNETDISKIIKFCIACTAQSGSQCILSRKPFLWIVFSFESDAQDCLSKVQIMYPDAIISDPPVDLNLKCLEDSYYVGSCQEMVTNGVPFSVVSPDGFDNNDWKMFFRYNSDFIGPMLYYEPTKYSLLYNLFEKLYDLGAKKVILDGNLYCAHFGSAAAHKHAFEKIHSRYLEPLEPERAPEAHKQKVTERMNRYSGIPWCFTHELGLYCLVVKIDSDFHDHFMEISKKTLGNRECIFIKSIPGAIWIGFPDKLICKNSEKTVNKFLSSIKQTSQVFVTIPSNNLLESISFRDLAGDAYDLAFLSSQLEDFKPITRPHIIERIRTQRMEQQECNETVFSITLDGTFCCRNTFPVLTFVQIVKLFIKFSKVIPLAATGWRSKLTLIYNSWHEAHTAFHYINELRTFKVPYCEQFNSACLSEQKQLDCLNISVYYIINDKRKVLEKIVQNLSLVNQTESNSSTVQSTTGIDVLDAEMIKKLQYLFVITTNSGFKFTSGMISIIKLNLVQMNCPVCIEFEDKIWVGVDDSEKGKKAKTRIDHIKFRILHEYEDDFEVGVVMESTQELPPKVNEMLANKLMNPKNSVNNVYLNSDAYPLGHFNYSYRKAAGMSISRYCQLNE